jgi:hypothetical protein
VTALERRLVRLEAEAGIGADLPVIFVSFVSPDGADPPATTATVNGCVWHRAPDETKEAFLDRVKAEARAIRPGGVVVGFLA